MITAIAIKSQMTDAGNFILGKRYFFKLRGPMFGYGSDILNTVDEYGNDMAFHDETHLGKYFKEIE